MDLSKKFSLVNFSTTYLVVGTFVSIFSVSIYTLYKNQNKFLYYPNPPNIPKEPSKNPHGYVSPGEYSKFGKFGGLKDDRIIFEDKMLKTKDSKLIHIWLMLQQPDSKIFPTLIYFHGNAGNMGFRLPNAVLMFAQSKFNILMMDYRGYGMSQGEPDEVGLNIDAETVLEFAKFHPKLQGSPIFLFGRSLGGAVSVSLASKYHDSIAGLILENTFTSIPDMVDQLFPILKPIKHWVLSIRWDSLSKISSLPQPILFISGDRDELVPPSHMTRLFASATRSTHREFFSIKGGGHNDSWEKDPNYYSRLKEFTKCALSATHSQINDHPENEGEKVEKEEEARFQHVSPNNGQRLPSTLVNLK